MSGDSPVRDGGIFDLILLGDKASPGTVTLSGHERVQNLDVKESDGQKGASTTWKGTKPGSFTATFSLAIDPIQGIDDFELWDDFAEELWSTIPPKSGKKPVAKDIYHPDLERNGFKAVILQEMGGMQHDGKGGATIAVKLSEYFPPKPVSTGNPKPKVDPNDPITKAQAQFDALKKEAFGP